MRSCLQAMVIGKSASPGKAPHYPGTPYVLLHSISHALMAEIALECGYPASSLKERVYALSGPRGRRRFRPLRHADLHRECRRSGDARRSRRHGSQIRLYPSERLERLRICSNDPVCADHEPDDRSGDRATHGAACHGCLLIAETSCEMRNLFLDRGLLLQTMAEENAAFFQT